MHFGDSTSGWWFYGRLRPSGACRFNVQQVRLWDGTYVEVFEDMITVWSCPGEFVIGGRDEAREVFDLTVSAYALITGIVLDWSLDGWVEARNASFDGTVVGVIVDPRDRDPKLPARSRRSVAMRRACKLVSALCPRDPDDPQPLPIDDRQPFRSLRLAVRDVRSALREPGDDAFVFAYRALEDLAYAYSGRSGQLRPSDWTKLTAHLGRDPQELKLGGTARLAGARHRVAHGEGDGSWMLTYRFRRVALLDLARRLVAEALARDSFPLKVAWLWPLPDPASDLINEQYAFSQLRRGR